MKKSTKFFLFSIFIFISYFTKSHPELSEDERADLEEIRKILSDDLPEVVYQKSFGLRSAGMGHSEASCARGFFNPPDHNAKPELDKIKNEQWVPIGIGLHAAKKGLAGGVSSALAKLMHSDYSHVSVIFANANKTRFIRFHANGSADEIKKGNLPHTSIEELNLAELKVQKEQKLADNFIVPIELSDEVKLGNLPGEILEKYNGAPYPVNLKVLLRSLTKKHSNKVKVVDKKNQRRKANRFICSELAAHVLKELGLVEFKFRKSRRANYANILPVHYTSEHQNSKRPFVKIVAKKGVVLKKEVDLLDYLNGYQSL